MYARAESTGSHSNPITADTWKGSTVGGVAPQIETFQLRNSVRDVDRLDTPVGVTKEKALLVKSIFEPVTELSVAHGIASCETRYGSMWSTRRGES